MNEPLIATIDACERTLTRSWEVCRGGVAWSPLRADLQEQFRHAAGRRPCQGRVMVGQIALALVAKALVTPHYSSRRARSMAALAERSTREVFLSLTVLGIPEHVGLLRNGPKWEVVGPGPVTVFTGDRAHEYREGARVTLGTGEA